MKSTKTRLFLRAGLILAGLAFVFYGFTRGEIDIVLKKAITICLECIGIG
jgi:hypothetical protein